MTNNKVEDQEPVPPKSYKLEVRVPGGNAPLKVGTGWLLRADIVVTALHVVGSHTEEKWSHQWRVGATYHLVTDDGSIELTPVEFDKDADIALLKLPESATQLCVLPHTTRTPKLNASWLGPGFPNTLGIPFTLGGSVRAVNKANPSQALQLHIDAGTNVLWQGVSGCPVLVDDHVVGIILSTIDGYSAALAASIDSVRQLAKRAKIELFQPEIRVEFDQLIVKIKTKLDAIPDRYFDGFLISKFRDIYNDYLNHNMDRHNKTNIILKQCDLVFIERQIEDWSSLPASILLSPDDSTGKLLLPAFEATSPPPKSQIREKLHKLYAERARLSKEQKRNEKLNNKIKYLRAELEVGNKLMCGSSLGNERYVLLECLGKGRIAEVWRATDQEKKQDVAIKVLDEKFNRDKMQKARFYRRAIEMRILDHPDIVRVRADPAEEDGFHYFVMDYKSGGDLDSAVRNQRISRKLAIDAILSICDALDNAHNRGIIHGDVNPANILLDKRGKAFLTNFNLCSARDASTNVSCTSAQPFRFVAPEVENKADDIDQRADVFSLGMSLVAIIYWHSLPVGGFKSSTQEYVRHLEISPELQAVLMKAVAEIPKDRFSSVVELRYAIESAVGPSRNRKTVSERILSSSEGNAPSPHYSPVKIGEKKPFWPAHFPHFQQRLLEIASGIALGIFIIFPFLWLIFRPSSPSPVFSTDFGVTTSINFPTDSGSKPVIVLKDSDGDSVPDASDDCKHTPPGLFPDPSRPGCPLPDRDQDWVPDSQDDCADTPGAPGNGTPTHPHNKGCPNLITLSNGQLTASQPLFFKAKTDEFHSKQDEFLLSLLDAIKSLPQFNKLRIKVHSSDVGKALDSSLSDLRIRSVRQWLITKGINRNFFDDQDLSSTSNKISNGIALNIIIEFKDIQPPPPEITKQTINELPAVTKQTVNELPAVIKQTINERRVKLIFNPSTILVTVTCPQAAATTATTSCCDFCEVVVVNGLPCKISAEGYRALEISYSSISVSGDGDHSAYGYSVKLKRDPSFTLSNLSTCKR